MSTTKVVVLCLFIGMTAVGLYRWSHNRPHEEILVQYSEPMPAPAVVTPLAQMDPLIPLSDDSQLPAEVDYMALLFQPYPPQLPFVETLSYTGRVDWLTGRAAYLGDYAAHYKTSKHFISRSLHGMGQYLSDVVSQGERFNVLRVDQEFEFHLVLDLSRLKMWVYVCNLTEGSRMLLKSYRVAAGQRCQTGASGCLTPTGIFALGEGIAVYKEGSMGMRHHQKIEMMTVFGKRWIPLSRELANCTGSCKGLGIHGMPWIHNPATGELLECRDSVGHYQSDGCIRMLSEDMEELFAVIVSRPSYVHIVRDFSQAQLPGNSRI